MAKINWYPGHMARTVRELSEIISKTDAVVEVIDARIPISSRNTDLNRIIGDKPRILIFNRADQASQAETDRWIAYFQTKNITVLPCDSKSGLGIASFAQTVRNVLTDRITRLENRGIGNMSLKVVVVGIPNVGKSSFINRVSGRKAAKTEDRPGVTRQLSWIRLEKGLDLLDSPGLLPPRIDHQKNARHLAFTGAIKDEITDIEELASALLAELSVLYPDELKKYIGFTEIGEPVTEQDSDDESLRKGYEILTQFSSKRGFLMRGGVADTARGAKICLDEFRSGKMGRLTLEKVKKD